MILLYHGIVEDGSPNRRWCVGQALPLSTLERHLKWATRYGRIVSLPEYLEQDERHSWERVVAVTFDDGLANTFENAGPLLRRLKIPATFFVSTLHLEHGKLLWFSYLNALCFEEIYSTVEVCGITHPLQTLEHRKRARHALGLLADASGNPQAFCDFVARSYPVPVEIAVAYEGMTHQQLRDTVKDGLFEIGAHSLSHPYLSQVSREVQFREVFESKQHLTELTGHPVRYFAYPSGDYNQDTLELVKAAGYEAAFATKPRGIGQDRRYELARVGIYSRSLLKFFLKILGMRALPPRLRMAWP